MPRTQATSRDLITVAAVAIALAALGAVGATFLAPEVPLRTVLFFAAVGAIAVFGAIRAARIALGVVRHAARHGGEPPPSP